MERVGEIEIINYALTNSKLINASKTIIKLTGKLRFLI